MAKMNLNAFDQPATEPAHHDSGGEACPTVVQESAEPQAALPGQPARRVHKTSLYIPLDHYKTLEQMASELSYTMDAQGRARRKVKANELVVEAVEQYLKTAGRL